MRLRVSASPRIHIGLSDLAGVSARSFCGVGFSIAGPSTCWSIEDSDRFLVQGTSDLDISALDKLGEIIETSKRLPIDGFTANLEKSPPQHIGLGSKTSLLLSLIAAIDRLKALNLSADQIQRMSGRGGASGVGINLFFSGGIVWDGGHPWSISRQFFPSSASKMEKPPPMLARWPFPDRWLVGLALPDKSLFSGVNEISFFRSNTPIPDDEALKTMSSMYHGVIPAFVTSDVALLKESLEDIHSTGLKRRELLAQSPKTIRAMDELRKLSGVAVGLSSLGPLIYGIFDKNDAVSQAQFEQTTKAIGANYLGSFSGQNSGFEVEAT